MNKKYSHYVVKLLNGRKGEGLILLPKIKKEYGFRGFRKIILLLRNNVYYKDYFFLELFPQNINHIVTEDYIPLSCNGKEITELELFNELECQIALLSCFADKLKTFAKLRNGFEKALFKGDYSSAQEQLEEIRKNFGYSFWYLESMLILSNYSMDTFKSGELYQQIKESCSNIYIRNFVKALRRKNNIFERYEDSSSFLSKKSKDIYNYESIDEFQSIYFEYYFSHDSIKTLSPIQFRNLLQMSSHFNITDMFILIDRLIIHCLENQRIDTRYNLLELVHIYDLPFSCKKTSELVNNCFSEYDSETLAICRLKDALCNKNIKNEQVNNIIEQFPNSFHIILTCVKLKVVYGVELKINGTLLKSLIDVLYHSTIKEGNYHLFGEIQSLAERFLLILDSTTLRFQYMNYYYDIFKSMSDHCFSDILTSDYYNRGLMYYINNEEIENKYIKLFGGCESNWYHDSVKLQRCTYDWVSKMLFKASKMTSVDTLQENIVSNCDDAHIVVNNRIYEKLFYQYVDSNEVLKAIVLYINLFFTSKFKVCSFDNQVVEKKCRGNILRELYSSIDFCIYAHITDFRGAIGTRYNSDVASSALQVLKSNNIMFPSQIKTDTSNVLILQKYIYFFRHICEKDLLISILTAYSVNDDDDRARTKIILSERIKILEKAYELESDSYERKEIIYQIKEAKNDITFLEKSELENTLVSSAKIFEDSIFVSDTEIIFPFFETVTRIVSDSRICSHNDFRLGESYLFKDALIKYKKAFIKSLDQQIGINIRHGFMKDKIISFFCQRNLAFKSMPKNDDEIRKFTRNKALEFTAKKETSFLVPYIEVIACFSQELYSLVDFLVDEIRINHTSDSNETSVFKIYILEKDIINIYGAVSNIANSYEFKRCLHDEFVNICDFSLNKLGEYVENKLCEECGKLIDKFYGKVLGEDQKINSEISDLKSCLPGLSREISQWFRIIRWGNEMCIVDKYFMELTNKFSYITYNISKDFPKEIKLNYLHYINLILSNLIMNAEEHSGLLKSDLIVSISLDLKDSKTIIIRFKNNINASLREIIYKNICILEQNLNAQGFDIEERKKGNGFYHIKSELDLNIGPNWSVTFCKDELPEYFSLFFLIGLEDGFV